jgi:hypothetical protein
MKCREREATRSRCGAVPRSWVTPRPFSSSPRSQVHEAHTSARIPSAVLMSKPSSSSRTTVGRMCPAGGALLSLRATINGVRGVVADGVWRDVGEAADAELTDRHTEITTWDDMFDELKPVLARRWRCTAG